MIVITQEQVVIQGPGQLKLNFMATLFSDFILLIRLCSGVIWIVSALCMYWKLSIYKPYFNPMN